MNDASAVRAGDALLLGNGAQLQLLEPDDLGLPPEAYASTEARGRFTGERLFFSNPQLYSSIVKMLARDMPYREVEDILGVSVNTVCGVAWREKTSIETVRNSLGRVGLDVSRLSLEEIRSRLADPEERKKISAKDLAVIHGIATTNAQLMLGGATARIETPVVTPPTHDAYAEFIKNVTPISTGSVGGTPRLKEAVPGALDAPAVVPGATTAGQIEGTPAPSTEPPSEPIK